MFLPGLGGPGDSVKTSHFQLMENKEVVGRAFGVLRGLVPGCGGGWIGLG